MELSQAAAANAQVRRAFKSGRTRSFEWRTQQLVALKALLQKDEGEIAQALYQDLGKSPFESFATEIGPLLNSCDETIKSLKAWMSPQKVSLPLVTLPGSASILAEPLGAVLIFSAWNFPICELQFILYLHELR
ncbi:hypothetical protein KP509_27G059200 [Ceratopteris richardii]|uniref:Aldehyde dehydrogenase domain-containing protein n=1 Tax=Ceratopteris richardii TaxID=49495 RepID=A0A8T2RJD6_CERRI|nr:hypothetical protein KP509_27G059200 [Ceratopteris richardii]